MAVSDAAELTCQPSVDAASAGVAAEQPISETRYGL